ncbi:Fe(3+) ABC transporter substrate-binding protein [Bacillus sp. AK128]
MKKSLKFLLFSVMAFGLVLAAGCAQKEETATEPEKTDVKEETTSASSEEEVKDKGEVNLYTSRHYDTDTELYKKFEEETGIKVNVIQGDGSELMERLEREAEATEADVFLTADAGNLARLKEKGLTQAVTSDVLETNIPEKLRDVDNEWFGLTKRARVIVYAKDRVDPSNLSTYEDLTDAKWQGKVLIRSSENIYNQSLLASFIELNGEEQAKEWAAGVKANMAREPQGGDTDQVKAVVAGEGDIAISNTYYVGRLLNSTNPEEVAIGEQVGIFFPNQDTTGTHINISGASVTKHAKNVENAIAFLEFLSDLEAQSAFAEGNNEYPVNESATTSETLKSWGEFKEQDINLTILGDNNARAIQLFNEVGWK